jgi:hypothetical protein
MPYRVETNLTRLRYVNEFPNKVFSETIGHTITMMHSRRLCSGVRQTENLVHIELTVVTNICEILIVNNHGKLIGNCHPKGNKIMKMYKCTCSFLFS